MWVLGLQVNLIEKSQMSVDILLLLIKSKALLNVVLRCLQRLEFCVPIANRCYMHVVLTKCPINI